VQVNNIKINNWKAFILSTILLSTIILLFHFKTINRQRRIGGDQTGRKSLNSKPTRIPFALCYGVVV